MRRILAHGGIVARTWWAVGEAIHVNNGVASRNRMGMLSGADRQKARTVCIIGVQPFIPAVYGVKAPL
jgi:hypothetical protein